jgi:hypothetical protein
MAHLAAHSGEIPIEENDGAVLNRYEDPKYLPPIEECLYWAVKEREHERHMTSENPGGEAGHYGSLFKKLFGGKSANKDNSDAGSSSEKDVKDEKASDSLVITSAERKQAYRAFRTAGWISVFYLITTDILGPYSAPWAFAQLGIEFLLFSKRNFDQVYAQVMQAVA